MAPADAVEVVSEVLCRAAMSMADELPMGPRTTSGMSVKAISNVLRASFSGLAVGGSLAPSISVIVQGDGRSARLAVSDTVASAPRPLVTDVNP
jgi:hypothetical protein